METENLVTRITRFTLNQRVTMFMSFLTILAVGLIAANRLPLEMNPRGYEGHHISVRVEWKVGVAVETMDKIGIPLEEELSTVRGLESIDTSAYRSGAWVHLQFKYGTDMDVAYREVRDRVERARPRFPEGVERPRIGKYEPGAEPIVGFRITYDPNSDYYDLIFKHLITPLQRIDGVADIDFYIRQKEVRIQLDKDRAEASGINIEQLGRMLRADNFTLASGTVVDGGKKFTLKSASEFHRVEEIRNLPVKENLFLKDIAAVTYEPEESDRMARYNSKPTTFIMIKKEGEANTVDVSRRIIEAIEELKQNPKLAGFGLSVFENQGEEIQQRLTSLIDNGKVGAFLAAIVLFFFLRQFRMTAVIAMAIPLCLLIALTTLFFAGKTLNSLTIMGLVICVGLLVDNSVVVAENIHRHHQNGLSRLQACLQGVGEIGFSITIATLTTLIVFGSALMVEGRMKLMIQNMSLPVIASIIASLATALMFVPLCVYLTLPEKRRDFQQARKTPSAVMGRVFQRLYELTFERLNHGYNAALRFYLTRRLDLSLILIVLLSITYVASGTLNRSDRNEELIRRFSFRVRFPDGYSMDQRLAYFKKAEALAEKRKESYGLSAHEVHFSKWWGEFRGSFAVDRECDLTRQEAINLLFEEFPKQAGVHVEIEGKEGDERNDDKKYMHHVRLIGDDPELLAKVAEDLKPIFKTIPGVVSFLGQGEDDEGPSELAVIVDRDKASSIGVNPSTLAGTIGAAVRGDNLPRFNNKGRQVPVRLIFQEEDRSEISDLNNFQVPAEDGRMSTVGELTRTTILNNQDDYIRRRDRKHEAWFGMRLKPGPESQKTKQAIEQLKAQIDLPEGVSFDRIKTDFGDKERKMGANMLWISIVFVYMLMAFFFESLLIPLAIVLTIPLASMGAVLVLKVSNTYIDEMAYTGALLLVGIVVNNGIVLVDYARRLRRSGVERSEALLKAAQHRFRPIVMTALTTICGMIPLTFGSSVDMGVNFKSFGLILIGGMASATLFTLLAVPVFYTLIEDAQNGLRHICASVFDRSGAKVPGIETPSKRGTGI